MEMRDIDGAAHACVGSQSQHHTRRAGARLIDAELAMPPTPGAETPPIFFRQSRIQIPSVLPSLLQTELLFLDRLLRKNKPQHRSSVFFQKSTHVLRLAKRLAAVIDEVVKVNETGSASVAETLGRAVFANGDKIIRESRGAGKVERHYKTLVELVDKVSCL